MLKDGENVFLDDITTDDVERELGVPVIPISGGGDALLSVMME